MEKGLLLGFEVKPNAFAVLTEMEKEGQCEFLSPIRADLRVQRFGDIVEVEGNIDTLVQLTCGRCLKNFQNRLNSSFSLTYKHGVPDTEAVGTQQEEIELTEEDMGLIYYQGEEIDLQNEIQEQVVMALPLRALCKTDCKGLCPQCGCDQNQGDCGCTKTTSSGRFDILKNLNLGEK
jgi:uncharacterized protein